MSRITITAYVKELNKDTEVVVDIGDLIREVDEENILSELNYDVEYCFTDWKDFNSYVEANKYDFEFPYKEEYSTYNQQDIYDRMEAFIGSNYFDLKAYDALDKFLTDNNF